MIEIDVRLPLARITLEVRVSLEARVTASRRSVYLISGSPILATPTARFKGPTDDDYTQEDVGPDAPGP